MMRKEVQVLVITIFSFIWSLMFVVEGGIHNFDLFDANAGHIQLLICLVLQTLFLPWIIGIHKISQMIYFRTGQYIPIFYVLVIRIFVPIFAIIITIIAIINEFADTEKRLKPVEEEGMNYNQGYLWGGRLIWLLPLVIMVVLMFVPVKNQETWDDLLTKQYGIRFDDSRMSFF